ncbi:SGNH/GDSL hydrolase family protein [Brachybacterium sp. JHP9]|uniref:SGNH/GDSL hydrolase family protein n=1 Tax=Brachybacterium equifaecis TaxID=2910770 RepID=A0ABT0QXT3_9MICO|nr:SGNH/GDSL hydrolase family protein [Brachybacterium equifaecis]MCL6422490.1 SGNH/GDSL hydrolase family protein [Brachybacterium equifaecis]
MSHPVMDGPSADAPQPWRRFVAIGDSFTEGIGDPDPDSPGGNRGWADLVAQELGRGVDGFEYANLAIRGRLHRQILDEQLEPALALRPDLLSICAGGNDVIRGRDPDEIAAALDEAVGSIADAGATVLLWTGPDPGHAAMAHLIRGRVAIFNENLRVVAQRHDAALVDLWALRSLTNPAMWAEDRLHFSPEGHLAIAAHVLDTLGVESTLEPHPLEDPESRPWREARQQDLHWARVHFGPWVLRRLRGQSSGDGLAPKRPLAAPVFGKPMPLGVSATEPEDS